MDVSSDHDEYTLAGDLQLQQLYDLGLFSGLKRTVLHQIIWWTMEGFKNKPINSVVLLKLLS